MVIVLQHNSTMNNSDHIVNQLDPEIVAAALRRMTQTTPEPTDDGFQSKAFVSNTMSLPLTPRLRSKSVTVLTTSTNEDGGGGGANRTASIFQIGEDDIVADVDLESLTYDSAQLDNVPPPGASKKASHAHKAQ